MGKVNPKRVPEAAGDATTVHIPRRVLSWSEDDSNILLTVEAAVCRREEMKASYLQYGSNYRHTGEFVDFVISFSAVDDFSFRYKVTEGDESYVGEQFLPCSGIAKDLKFSVQEDEETLSLHLAGIAIRVNKDPYTMSVTRSDGRQLFSEYNDDLNSAIEDRRQRFRREMDDYDLSFPLLRTFPLAQAFTEKGEAFFVESVRIRSNERFYGFGERFSALDKYGTRVDNVVINPVGVSTNESYKPVPFFLSSRGYAAYYNTACPITFHMGDESYKTYQSLVSAPGLDVFYFCHEKPQEQLTAYSQLTGTAKCPPLWSFGIWMSRNCYRSSQEMLEVAEELRERELPADVLHLDWDYGVDYELDFTFDPQRFPDVPALTAKLNDMGFELSIWQLPYVAKNSRLYNSAPDKSYFVFADTDEGVIDFSKPEAVAWYQEKITSLLKQGFKAVVTDFGEAAPYDGVYENISGKEMHNLYPLLYARAANEAIESEHPGDSVLWGRSAYAGSQPYPLFWGGDADSDFEGMYHSLRGGLSIGLSGFPFWSHDVGGYFGTPDPEVYIRWVQFGLLSPFVRFHGTTAREPWHFGEEAVHVYKKYAGLRYELLPYLVSEARSCTKDGTPLMRALWLDHSDDSNTERIDDQYMLGRSLLVAPVFESANSRKVYLPAGSLWQEQASGKQYKGGSWYEIAAPLDTVPLFIRCNSALPLTSAVQSVSSIDTSILQWDIFPEIGKGSASVYWPQTSAEQKLYFNYDKEAEVLEIVFDEENFKSVTYRIHHKSIRKVFVNGLLREHLLDNDNNLLIGEKIACL